MPIDPSIITSGNQMAPVRLPDVNAMMQTQTKGLENIYTLERQREADAAAAREQEQAALTEALAPAFSTAYRDPSDGGIDSALALVPEQFRAEMAAQAAKLKAIPTREGRMAAIEASLAGSDIGKAILARVMTPYQAGTLDLQRQQQEFAKQRLALEQQQQAQQPAAGDYATVETAEGLYVINRKTGEMAPAISGGTGTGTGEGPIDTQTPPQVLQPKPKTAEINQTARRAASLLDNVVRNADAVNTVISETPEAFQPSAAEAAAGFLPWGQQQVKAWEQNPQRKIVYNRMRQSIDALLTLATGAAYTQAQLDAQIGAYMPGFFDEDAVKRDKIMALRDRIESEKLNAGPAWTPEQEARAQQVFAQFENIVDAMSMGGAGAAGRGAAVGGEVDTSNPLLQD